MEKVSKTLAGHLERITELVSRMDKHEKKYPQIERDMLLSALSDMYDAVYRLDEGGGLEEVLENVPVHEEPEEPSMTVLMADTESEPVYAVDPDQAEQEERSSQLPTMEEIESRDNESMFDDGAVKAEELEERVEEPVAEPEPIVEQVEDSEPKAREEKPIVAEEPQTLWDKLNSMQKTSTIADTVVAQRTISDIYEATKEESEEDQHLENTVLQSAEEEPEQPAEPEPEPEPVGDKAAEERIASLFDYIKPAGEKPVQRTLAETLGERSVHDIDKKIGANKVEDLRTVININDKFSFMNELFRNNMKGYNDFILRLNAIESREEALKYVEEVAATYNWDNESATVKTFYTIFDRKF